MPLCNPKRVRVYGKKYNIARDIDSVILIDHGKVYTHSDAAIQNAVTEASKTVRNIDSVFVKDIKAHVKDGKISSYGVICKISFRLD